MQKNSARVRPLLAQLFCAETYSNRATLSLQHVLSLRKRMFSSCRHCRAPLGLAKHLQVSPSQRAATQLSGWGLISSSLPAPGAAWAGQHTASSRVAGQSWVPAASPTTGVGEPGNSLGKSRPTQHGWAGFLSPSRRCLRQWWRRQVRRRREVRGTSTPTAMTTAGDTLLSGPVEEAAGTEFVHEENKTTQTHFRHSLASPWGEMGQMGALGAHAGMQTSGTASRPVLGV